MSRAGKTLGAVGSFGIFNLQCYIDSADFCSFHGVVNILITTTLTPQGVLETQARPLCLYTL